MYIELCNLFQTFSRVDEHFVLKIGERQGRVRKSTFHQPHSRVHVLFVQRREKLGRAVDCLLLLCFKL